MNRRRIGAVSAAASAVVALAALAALAGCEDPPAQRNPFDPPPDKAKQPPALTAPLPEGPPQLEIDTIGPKVGFARIAFQYPDARQKLAAELEQKKQHFSGQEARLRVDRKAKPEWVAAYLEALAKIGVPRVLVRTETRAEFPPEVGFVPQAKVGSPPGCAPVAMVLPDRSTAVWKLSGGAAARNAKGMAGPDLTMTGDTLERVAKACKGNSVLFVSGTEGVEWGLTFDLAASSHVLQGAARMADTVLLSSEPTPGHKVDLAGR